MTRDSSIQVFAHECEHCHTCYETERERARCVYKHITAKENNMEEQMEQVWRCKDGKGGVFIGSKEEVEQYLKSKNPLAGMQFPYWASDMYTFAGNMPDQRKIWKKELKAVIAFANLAPLIQPLYERWEKSNPRWPNEGEVVIRNLLLAYKEALKQVPQ